MITSLLEPKTSRQEHSSASVTRNDDITLKYNNRLSQRKEITYKIHRNQINNKTRSDLPLRVSFFL